MVDKAQKRGHLPAIAVLVRSRGSDVYLRAQGKRSMQNEPRVEAGDVWHLGSDTKAMTAFLVALAVQEKHLSYEARLADLFEKQIKLHSLNTELTLLDLLSHGSGLKDVQEIHGGVLWKDLSKSSASLAEQRLEMARAALEEPPHIDPREAGQAMRTFKYANINYVILGAVLEKVYGMAWEELLREGLFQPLQMSSCGFGVSGRPDETEPSQPWPHVYEEKQLIGVPPKYKLDNPPMLGPAGTAHCNLEDWRKFISELILAWRGNGILLRDREIAATYFSNAKGSPYTYGGWGRSDDKFKTAVFQHNGSNTFNYAVALFAPAEDTIVLLATNSGRPEAEEAMQMLKKSLSDIVFRR
ncbi:MAG: serine hydrolase [Nitrospirae bacterium]|nr:serine hydrolase [Nitrospirota bacterium]